MNIWGFSHMKLTDRRNVRLYLEQHMCMCVRERGEREEVIGNVAKHMHMLNETRTFNLCHMWTHTDMCGMRKYLRGEGYIQTEGEL